MVPKWFQPPQCAEGRVRAAASTLAPCGARGHAATAQRQAGTTRAAAPGAPQPQRRRRRPRPAIIRPRLPAAPGPARLGCASRWRAAACAAAGAAAGARASSFPGHPALGDRSIKGMACAPGTPRHHAPSGQSLWVQHLPPPSTTSKAALPSQSRRLRKTPQGCSGQAAVATNTYSSTRVAPQVWSWVVGG
jgi:hypothetical protein